ncbi:MAG: permease [Verrucomicrobiota bacterium]
MSSCCSESPQQSQSCCSRAHSKFDLLLWGSAAVIGVTYFAHIQLGYFLSNVSYLAEFAHGVYEMMNMMWWGFLMGMLAVGIIHQVPRDAVLKVLGRPGSVTGILRAMAAGLVLDLCNHGIVLVGMKLYERGASLGQVFAFLIASPWNSLSLTLILIALIGVPLSAIFIVASAGIAFFTGWLIDHFFVRFKTEPESGDVRSWRSVWQETRAGFPKKTWLIQIVKDSLQESRMILRWLLFGVVLASAIRAFLSPETFQDWFGPSLAGLGLTLIAATLIEVCSEGSTPIAADLVTRADAPGNGFTFLMAGAATDYTELMALKETTRRWGHALLLPALTVPQVLVLGYWINTYAAKDVF